MFSIFAIYLVCTLSRPLFAVKNRQHNISTFTISPQCGVSESNDTFDLHFNSSAL